MNTKNDKHWEHHEVSILMPLMSSMLSEEQSQGGRTAAPRQEWLPGRTLVFWRIVQVIVWFVGAGILGALIFMPAIGIHAFWNILIPVAPALVVLAPGVWRNICPLASTGLFARHMNFSVRNKLADLWRGRLNLIGVLALLLIVPLRHVVLDTSGPATAVTIGCIVAAAVLLGLSFEWKSGWCSGLCPVHPVEVLYGSSPLLTVPNVHCHLCEECGTPCPDSTPSMHSLITTHSRAQRLAGTLMAGGFAGFIWGWFQVPDFSGDEGWRHLDLAYGLPLGGLAVTLSLFLLLRFFIPARHEKTLVRAFATAAVACYYWYRLPALFGFGPFPGDGMLVDLTGSLPSWFPAASQVASTALFLWLMLSRNPRARSWTTRPPFARGASACAAPSA